LPPDHSWGPISIDALRATRYALRATRYALRAAGCTGLQELDVETDEYEVGGAVCADGKAYDMKLDKTFNVISKREDRL
jgi:hypothetical protein